MKIKKVTGEVLEAHIDEAWTVADLCDEVVDKWSIPKAHQRLQFCGKSINAKSGMRLSEFGITDESEVTLRVALKGGCGAGCDICGAGGGCSCTLV